MTSRHTCHWPDCATTVPPSMWGCKDHWFKLPKFLRDRVWATYVPGQEITKTPSAAYLAVAREVQEWIANRWKIYHMDDVTWWVARSREEAIKDMHEQQGQTIDIEGRELSEEELDRLKFIDTDEADQPRGRRRSFRRELERRMAEGLNAPELFATTEI